MAREKEIYAKGNMEEVASIYEPGYSDPIKNMLRKDGKQEYLITHKADYARLYIQLGIAHPKEYLFGWVKQTKSYWNGGYKEFIDWKRRGAKMLGEFKLTVQ